MSENNNKRICPPALAGSLDNSWRQWLQNPRKILQPFIKEGMTVLDLGCGPGFFTLEIAKIVGSSGKVIAADLQEGMLAMVARKAGGTSLEKRIEIHQCQENKIGITEMVDFILAFWMIHEVNDPEKLIEELTTIIQPGGTLLIIEPKLH
ncbi:MAG: methyltransferase domain-containing protein, partial [Bacteroidia bacterium]|nr:methyltransferase domain-containing protein [Bacteroidia bacterium]